MAAPALFDQDAAARQTLNLGREGPVVRVDLKALDFPQLVELQQQILALLPSRELRGINLEEELVTQYQLAKFLMASVLSNEGKGIPENQKAQIINSCSAALKAIVELQNGIYGSERLKAIEVAVIAAFKDETVEISTKFFEKYAELVRNTGQILKK